MKNHFKFVLAVAVIVFLGVLFTPVRAQAPTAPVQQSATRLDAAGVCQSSASTGATLTFAPPPTQSFYLTEIDFENVAGASAVTAAAPTTITISNISGTPPSWTMASGTTAGGAVQSFSVNYPNGLKSLQPGASVVITLPTFATNQTIRVNACGYYGL